MDSNYYGEQQTFYAQEEPVTIYAYKATKVLLIVDDSPLIINLIMELLEDVAGITAIKSCSTYTAAIDLLTACSPAVVLLDINLPDKNGIILLKHIKTSYPGIAVIMVTNQSQDFYKNLCLEIGAHYFLDKSNDFELLPALVATIVQ